MKDNAINLLLGALNLALIYFEYRELSWIFSRSPITPLTPANPFHVLTVPPIINLIPSNNIRSLKSCKMPELPVTVPSMYGVHTLEQDPNNNPWYLHLNGWQLQFIYFLPEASGQCYAASVTFIPPSDCNERPVQCPAWDTDYIKYFPEINWPS